MVKKSERAKRAIAQTMGITFHKRLSATSWTHSFLLANDPGVSLRFTPGFMPSPRSVQTLINLFRPSLSLSRRHDKLKFIGHHAMQLPLN